MSSREEKILRAAMEMFSRYGVKRTSMNDLAQAAGISRQTLYNAFSNKDDVMRALIRHYAVTATAEIEAGLEQHSTLSEQLDLAFRKITLEPYDLIQTSPNSEELIEGFNTASLKELAEVGERFRGVIEKMLAPYADTLAESGLSPSHLSDLVQACAKYSKHGATDRDHLVRRLDSLRNLVLVATGQS